LLVVVAAGSLATIRLNERASVVAQVRPAKSPDAMVERARTIMAKAGYSDGPGYSASGFYVDDDVVRWSAATVTSWFFVVRGVVSIQTAVGYTLFAAAAVWVFYVAVEPFVRRRWPAMLVAWVRVLAGNVRDPLVGRDALIGCATGVVAAFLTALNRLVASGAGHAGTLLVPDWHMFNGTGPFIGAVLAQFGTALFVSLLMLFLYFLLRVVVRSDWIALPLFALVSGGSRIVGIGSWAAVPVLIAGGALRTFALVRIGLVAGIVDSFVWTLFITSPMTTDTSAWYASAGYATLMIVGAIAVYGFRTALAGRPILPGAAIGD
jgi:hypothetical protein